MFSLYTFGYFLLSLIVTSIVISIRWAATRKLPRLGCASVIIILVFVLSIFFVVPPSRPSPAPPGPIEVAEMSTSQLFIVAKTYSHFQMDRSVDVYVLIITRSTAVDSASPTPNQTKVPKGATPLGTADAAI